jgi:hypothetical protein
VVYTNSHFFPSSLPIRFLHLRCRAATIISICLKCIQSPFALHGRKSGFHCDHVSNVQLPPCSLTRGYNYTILCNR